MINYKFGNILTGLIGFVASIEAKLQNIVPGVPVYMMNTGDSSYFFKGKFEESFNNEIYQKVPRAIINTEDITLQLDQNTNQYVKLVYINDEKTYQAMGRRQATTFPITLDFVCSNFPKALEYFEMLASVFSVDNVFTYEFGGNTYQASYNSTNFSFVKNEMTSSSATTNYSVKVSVDVIFQPFFIRPNSIQLLDDSTLKVQMELDVYDPLYKDAINPDDPDNPKYTKNKI